MNVFVTGGAGFIGSHICQALLAEGHAVTVYDNLVTGHADHVPEGAQLVEDDIRDLGDLQTAMINHDAVIHLAAQALVPESVSNPQKTFDVNIGGGYNVLVAMKELGIKKLIYSSTAAVYGMQEKMPIKEYAEKHPINPYGASKLALEHLAHAYHASYGFDVTVFRYFNPFGPGEQHDPETHAIPNFMKAIRDDKPITLYWSGEQIRDFFYVKDLAEVHVKALSLNGYQEYNVGSGTGITISELVQTIFKVTGKKVVIKDLGKRAGDPPALLADITKAKKELGWKPTNLGKALSATWEDFNN